MTRPAVDVDGRTVVHGLMADLIADRRAYADITAQQRAEPGNPDGVVERIRAGIALVRGLIMDQQFDDVADLVTELLDLAVTNERARTFLSQGLIELPTIVTMPVARVVRDLVAAQVDHAPGLRPLALVFTTRLVVGADRAQLDAVHAELHALADGHHGEDDVVKRLAWGLAMLADAHVRDGDDAAATAIVAELEAMEHRDAAVGAGVARACVPSLAPPKK